MGSDFKSIPIIGDDFFCLIHALKGVPVPEAIAIVESGRGKDVSPLLAKCNDPLLAEDQGVSEVVEQLDRACKEAGFFYVKCHGIPDSLVNKVRELARQFFDLPYEEKLKIKMTPARGYRGYQRVGENITKGVPDMHEAIDCYKELKPGSYGARGKPLEGANEWPDKPINFGSVMEEYISLLTDLARNIMRGIALALGESPNAFEGEKAGDPFWVMRIIGYPGASDTNGSGMQENDIGCGAHTDYGLLTLVNQDENIPALQVRNMSGEWIWAFPIPGTFVCNIGDMLKIWSNGLYQPTLHRVINNSSMYRTSVAFFYEPNFDAAIEPLEGCKQKTGGTAKYEKAIYGEHLASKVTTNFG